jgi:hypothetical protein
MKTLTTKFFTAKVADVVFYTKYSGICQIIETQYKGQTEWVKTTGKDNKYAFDLRDSDFRLSH